LTTRTTWKLDVALLHDVALRRLVGEMSVATAVAVEGFARIRVARACAVRCRAAAEEARGDRGANLTFPASNCRRAIAARTAAHYICVYMYM